VQDNLQRNNGQHDKGKHGDGKHGDGKHGDGKHDDGKHDDGQSYSSQRSDLRRDDATQSDAHRSRPDPLVSQHQVSRSDDLHQDHHALFFSGSGEALRDERMGSSALKGHHVPLLPLLPGAPMGGASPLVLPSERLPVAAASSPREALLLPRELRSLAARLPVLSPYRSPRGEESVTQRSLRVGLSARTKVCTDSHERHRRNVLRAFLGDEVPSDDSTEPSEGSEDNDQHRLQAGHRTRVRNEELNSVATRLEIAKMVEADAGASGAAAEAAAVSGTLLSSTTTAASAGVAWDDARSRQPQEWEVSPLPKPRPVFFNGSPRPAESGPAPGQYDLPQALRVKSPSRMSGAFASTTPRFAFPSNTLKRSDPGKRLPSQRGAMQPPAAASSPILLPPPGHARQGRDSHIEKTGQERPLRDIAGPHSINQSEAREDGPPPPRVETTLAAAAGLGRSVSPLPLSSEPKRSSGEMLAWLKKHSPRRGIPPPKKEAVK
jgi:hypothetical protein